MYKYEILNTLVVHPKSKNKKTQTDKIKEGGKEWDGVRKEPYNNCHTQVQSTGWKDISTRIEKRC